MSERKQRDTTTEKAPSGITAELQTPDFARMTSSMVSGWTAVNSRLMSFATQSLQSNLAAAHELRQCETPKDVMDLQMRLARKVYEDWFDEARELSGMVAQMSSDAVEHLTQP